MDASVSPPCGFGWRPASIADSGLSVCQALESRTVFLTGDRQAENRTSDDLINALLLEKMS